MKKYIALSVAALAFVATGAQAEFKPGAFVGVDAGYSHTKVDYDLPGVNNKGGGMIAGVHFGYLGTMAQNWIWDLGARVGYDTTSILLGDTVDEDGDASTLHYKPTYNVGLFAHVGRMVGNCAAIFAGVNFDYTIATIKTLPDAGGRVDTQATVFSIAPELGVKFKLSEKWSATVTTGYKFGISAKANGVSMDNNKPSAYYAKAGVSYHF